MPEKRITNFLANYFAHFLEDLYPFLNTAKNCIAKLNYLTDMGFIRLDQSGRIRCPQSPKKVCNYVKKLR